MKTFSDTAQNDMGRTMNTLTMIMMMMMTLVILPGTKFVQNQGTTVPISVICFTIFPSSS